MKNKVTEANVIVSKTDYKTDQTLAQAARKNKDNLVAVDDAKVKKMVDTNTGAGSTSISNSTSPTTSTIGVAENDNQVDAVIEPQDRETIKYLSNVKDPNTNQVSKPFVIGDKNYQMVRGMKPNREIVMAVLCLDDKMIHGIEEFEKNVAIPMRERFRNVEPAEDKEKFVDHLNLSDVNGFKHFFVNTHTGDITAKFKSTDEMLKSGIPLKSDERYVDAKHLKKIRYENYFKPELNEGDDDEIEGTDMNKLKSDVKKLVTSFSSKFAGAISKIDKNVEKNEFLIQIAQMIGVPFNKLTSLINSFKDMANTQKTAEPTAQPTPAMAEHKVIKKDALLESLGVKQTIIKVKKNKDGGK